MFDTAAGDQADIPFFLDDGAGGSVARTPKQMFDDLDADEVIAREFTECVGL